MVSGHAYGKALRTVKTCVGTEWCRFGTQDSTGLGVKIEKIDVGLLDAGQGQDGASPAARGTAPRRPARMSASSASSRGYEIHFGGAAGLDIKGTELLCKVATEEEALEHGRRPRPALSRAGALSRAHLQMGEAGRRRHDPRPDRRRPRTPPGACRALPSSRSASRRSIPGPSGCRARCPRVPAARRPHRRWRRRNDDGSGHPPAAEWVDIGAAADILPRGARVVQDAPRRRCGVPHRRPTLSSPSTTAARTAAARCREGIVHGDAVTCPLHNWVISLATGEALGADEGCVATIPVKVEARPRVPRARRGRRCGGVSETMAAAVATRTTCPYCGVGCGVVARRGDDGRRRDRRRSGPSRRISAGSAPRARRSARPSASTTGCSTPRSAESGSTGTRPSTAVAQRLRRHDRRARAGLGRLLRLRPAPHRGLLRRQQADEGLHRLGQHRHQFAPLHGLVGRRPHARLRRRRGARLLRGSRRGRPRRPGRLQPRLVPSGPLPAPAWPRARSGRNAHRRHRSAPHRDRRGRRPAPRHRPGKRRGAVQRPARPSRRARARSTTAMSRATPTGFADALGRGTAARPRPAVARLAGVPSDALATFYDWFAATERVVTVYSQGVNQSVVGHRQGQRHHQLPPRHRPHRQAGRGAVLDHRPAECHGRARGRRPRQPARRASRPRERRSSRPRAGLLEVAAHRRQAGPEGRRPVRGRRRRPHQGAVDHGDQSGRQPARCRPRARALATARSSSSPMSSPTTTRCPLPMSGCPPPPGARRTARSPIPSAASRASGASCRPPARRGRTGGSSREVARRMGFAAPSTIAGRPRSSASMRR